MKKEFYVQQLQELVRLAMDRQFSNAEEHEPAFFAVLVYIANVDAELQSAAEHELIQMIEERKSQPYALISYCMRELRFPILKEKVTTLMNEAYQQPDYRYAAVLRNILQEYDSPSSPEDDIYDYYK
jgi:hypothetical protein